MNAAGGAATPKTTRNFLTSVDQTAACDLSFITACSAPVGARE